MERVVFQAKLGESKALQEQDLRYWLSQPVEARLKAVETLREQMHPRYAEQGLQRVCRIVALKAG